MLQISTISQFSAKSGGGLLNGYGKHWVAMAAMVNSKLRRMMILRMTRIHSRIQNTDWPAAGCFRSAKARA